MTVWYTPAGMVCQKATGVTSMTQGLSVTYSLSFQRSRGTSTTKPTIQQQNLVCNKNGAVPFTTLPSKLEGSRRPIISLVLDKSLQRSATPQAKQQWKFQA